MHINYNRQSPRGRFLLRGLNYILVCFGVSLAPPSASLRPAFGRAAPFAARLCRGSVRLVDLLADIPALRERLRHSRSACCRAAPFAARSCTCSAAFGTLPLPTLPQHTTPQHTTPVVCWVSAVAPASRDYPCGGNRKLSTAPSGLGGALRAQKVITAAPCGGLPAASRRIGAPRFGGLAPFGAFPALRSRCSAAPPLMTACSPLFHAGQPSRSRVFSAKIFLYP